MTYCEKRNEEISNEEWREHILSDKHIERAGEKRFCQICKTANFTSLTSRKTQFF